MILRETRYRIFAWKLLLPHSGPKAGPPPAQAQPKSHERDRIEIEVRLQLLMGAFDRPSMILSILDGARELCARIGDDAGLIEVLWWMGFAYVVQVEHPNAASVYDELLKVAPRTDDAGLVGASTASARTTSEYAPRFIACCAARYR